MKQVEVRLFNEGATDPAPLATVRVSDDAAKMYDGFKALGITVDIRRVRMRENSPCKIEVQLVHSTGVFDGYTVPDHGGIVDNAPRLAVESLLLNFDVAAFTAWAAPAPQA